MTTRAMMSECYLRDVSRSTNNRDVSRSTNNPHGFLMEHWRVIQNNDLSIEARL